MSDFELEPWERAALLADAVLHVEETETLLLACALVRRKSWIIFEQEKAKKEMGNWILLWPDLDAPRIWSPQPPTLQLRQLIKRKHELEKGRLFAWPKERLILKSNGEGAWLDAQYHVDVKFDISFEPAIWDDAHQLWNRVQAERADPNSDLNFAIRWRRSGEQKWASLFDSEEQYTLLLEIAEAALWEVGDQMDWVESNWRISHTATTGAYVNSLIGGTMRYSERLDHLLLAWSHFFAFDLLPRATQKARQRHRCLELFYNQRGNFVEVGFNGPPTQHERLEARFKLREWLERNAPDKIGELLPRTHSAQTPRMSQFTFEPWEEPLRKMCEHAGEWKLCSWQEPLRTVYKGIDAMVAVSGQNKRRLRVRPAGFLFTRGYHFLCVRDTEAPEKGSWLLVERRSQGPRPWSFGEDEPSLDALSAGLESGAIELARFCFFEYGHSTNHTTKVAFTLADGESVWLRVGDRPHEFEPFQLALSEDDFHDSQGYRRRLEAELARFGSDARFALNWLETAHHKKREFLFGVAGLRAFEELMRCILLTEPRLGELARGTMWALVEAPSKFSHFPGGNPDSNEKWRNQAPRLPVLARLLVEKWPLEVTEDDLRAHACLRRFLQRTDCWPCIDTRINAPSALSQHDLLEMWLRVRDWLQQNAPDEIEALLPS